MVISFRLQTYIILKNFPKFLSSGSSNRSLIVGEPFVFLEFQNRLRLTLRYVDTLINRFDKFVLAVDEILALELGRHESVG